MNVLFEAIGIFFMPIISFIFMYSFLNVISNKEQNQFYKVISSICFGLIAWTITGLMMMH